MYVIHDTQPYAIDPFNEAGIPVKERNELLISDFLDSLEALSEGISNKINNRYYRMREDFSGLEE